MPTLRINMPVCLKRIRKAWDKGQIAVQGGDEIGSYYSGMGRLCAIGAGVAVGPMCDNAWRKIRGVKRAAREGDSICIDLSKLEEAHFNGENAFLRCLVSMENKYGVKRGKR